MDLAISHSSGIFQSPKYNVSWFTLTSNQVDAKYNHMAEQLADKKTPDHKNHWNHIHKLHKNVVYQTIQVLVIYSINMVSISQYMRNMHTIYQSQTYPTKSICTHIIRYYIPQFTNNKHMQNKTFKFIEIASIL